MELDEKQIDPRTLDSASWTPEHLASLDMCVASGLTVTLDGKEWTFKPLRYRDLGALVQKMRSAAYETYEVTQQRLRKKKIFITYAERRSDLNGILYGMQGQDIRMMLLGPCVAPDLLKLSLSQHHPDVTDEDIDRFLDDPAAVNALMERFIELTLGPRPLAKGGDEGSDPTKREDASTSIST